jgi:hypothetical protein
MGVAFSSSTSCGFKEPVHPRLLTARSGVEELALSRG